MAEQSDEQRREALAGLARRIHGWGLDGAARLVLKAGASTSVIASHMLLLIQPLAPFAPWRQQLGTYAAALEDEASWQELWALLDAMNN